MHEINPRKCNSDSILSTLLKEKCHVLLLHFQPLTNQLISFNKVFSSVNTRLAFDTKISLPNLISNNEEEKIDEFQKDYNYKICYNIRLNNEKEHSKKKKEL